MSDTQVGKIEQLTTAGDRMRSMQFGVDRVMKLERELAAVTAERDALKVLAEVRGKGCQCGDDDACAFVRERDALVAENRWHPVSEPPNHHRMVLVDTANGSELARYINGWELWDGDEQNYWPYPEMPVIAWRELPRPPKDKVPE